MVGWLCGGPSYHFFRIPFTTLWSVRWSEPGRASPVRIQEPPQYATAWADTSSVHNLNIPLFMQLRLAAGPSILGTERASQSRQQHTTWLHDFCSLGRRRFWSFIDYITPCCKIVATPVSHSASTRTLFLPLQSNLLLLPPVHYNIGRLLQRYLGCWRGWFKVLEYVIHFDILWLKLEHWVCLNSAGCASNSSWWRSRRCLLSTPLQDWRWVRKC